MLLLATKIPEKPVRTRSGKRWLRRLTVAILIAAGSGLLLFLPPFALWPLYPVTLALHAGLGIVAAVAFLWALWLHGGRLRKTERRWMGSGLAFSLSFLLVLGTGVARLLQPELPAAWLVIHLAAGSLTILFGLLHGARVRLER